MACYGGIINTIRFRGMKQTAVEWLLDSLDYNQNMLGIKEIIEKAKEMEKTQMIEFFDDGCFETCYALYVDEIFDPKEKGKEIYDLTFKYKSK